MTYINQDRNPTVAGKEKAFPSMRLGLAALSLSMLMPSLDTSIANAGLPTLAHAFGASFQSVQWIVLAYLLAITALIVSVGRLGDIIGRKRLLLGGIALFTIASLLCGVASTLWWLLAARAAQGLGAAVMMALTVAMVGETVPKEKTGSAMGVLGTMSAIGTTLGPSLGGMLIASFGWPIIFLVNVPIGILNLYLAWRYLPADSGKATTGRVKFDVAGTALLALALAAYALAMTTGHGRFGSLNVILLVTAAVNAGLFWLSQKFSSSPLFRLEMLRLPGLSASLTMRTLVTTVVMATLVVGPFYLSLGLALQPAIVGLVLSVGPLVSALAGVPAGRLVDRFGTRTMTLTGLSGMVGGCFALTIIPASLGIPGYILPIAMVTCGYALFQAANNTSIMADIAPDKRGVISGMLSLSRNLGLITGASFMGAVFALASATTDVSTAEPKAIVTGMHITFAVAGILMLAARFVAGRHAVERQTI